MLALCLPEQPDFAANLRRLMARDGVSFDDLVVRSGVDARTISGLLNGRQQPQSRTLHRLAAALEVSADEFFQDSARLAHRLFDRHTNPVVDEVIAERPELFCDWTEGDFDDLYSRFGTGGALTREGAAIAAEQINRTREIQTKVAVLLETHEGQLLAEFVEMLFRRVAVVPNESLPRAQAVLTKKTHYQGDKKDKEDK